MNLTLAQIEIDASIGENARKPLGDLVHLNDGRRSLVQFISPVILSRLEVSLPGFLRGG